MKKNLVVSITSILMVCTMSTRITFASDSIGVNTPIIEATAVNSEQAIELTNEGFLSTSNEVDGVKTIKLQNNVVITDSLKINDGSTWIIDLNGYNLDLTKDTNVFSNGSDVTFVNGTITIDGVTSTADCILGVGHYDEGTLTLNGVTLNAKDYTSAYALIYVYNDNELNIINSTINAVGEKSSQGGVIKASGIGKGKINITDSALDFNDTMRGITLGNVNITGSTVRIKNLDENGINNSNLIINNSIIDITDCKDSGMKVAAGTNIEINNGSKVNIEEIIFRENSGKIIVDNSSDFNFIKVQNNTNSNINELVESEKFNYEIDNDGNVTKIPDSSFIECLTSNQLLENATVVDEVKTIKLQNNVVITDSLKINDGSTWIIDLNGYNLDLTKDTNVFSNGSDVTFVNGTITIDGVTSTADCILGVGHYDEGTLTLNGVTLNAKDYTSAYALIYVYNDNELNIINSTINAVGEKSSQGGVIKASGIGKGKINITDSALDFNDTMRGITLGNVNITGSTVRIKNLDENGINNSNLIINNSIIDITDCKDSGMKVAAGTNIEINNGSKVNIEEIIFRENSGKIIVDNSSDFNFIKVQNNTDSNINELIESNKYDYIINNNGELVIKESAKLKAIIEEANKYLADADKYTDKTIEDLENSLTEANTVLVNANATDEEIDLACNSLKAAIENLKLKAEVPEIPEDVEQQPTPPVDPSTPSEDEEEVEQQPTIPVNPSTPSEDEEENNNLVETGDMSSLGATTAMLIASGAALGLLKKRNQKK